MKTAILTFQESYNNGALLQAYALQTVLTELSNERCDILNYRCPYKQAQYSGRFNKNLLVYINKTISRRIQNEIKKKADSFRDKYLNITNKIYSSSIEMTELNNRYDKFFCGSDQIWNPFNTGGDETYFLNFVEDSKKIASYAPSIAISNIPPQFNNMFIKNINRFRHLSIREKSGQKLDPTLLLNKEEWNQIKQPINNGKPYIFVYYISYLPQLIKFAKELKRETGLEVVVAVKTVRDYVTCILHGFTARIISPNEFVGGIADANYIVTNSFHGTVFSVNYEKEFFAFGNKKGLAKGNSRIMDFLDLLGLSERFNIDTKSIKEFLMKPVEYKEVKKKLSIEKEKSLSYIKSALLD